jgi:hypothetical protein
LKPLSAVRRVGKGFLFYLDYVKWQDAKVKSPENGRMNDKELTALELLVEHDNHQKLKTSIQSIGCKHDKAYADSVEITSLKLTDLQWIEEVRQVAIALFTLPVVADNPYIQFRFDDKDALNEALLEYNTAPILKNKLKALTQIPGEQQRVQEKIQAFIQKIQSELSSNWEVKPLLDSDIDRIPAFWQNNELPRNFGSRYHFDDTFLLWIFFNGYQEIWNALRSGLVNGKDSKNQDLKPSDASNMFRGRCGTGRCGLPSAIYTLGQLLEWDDRIAGTQYEKDLIKLIEFAKKHIHPRMPEDGNKQWLLYFRDKLSLDNTTLIEEFIRKVYIYLEEHPDHERAIKHTSQADTEELISHGVTIHLDYKRKNILCYGKTLTTDRLFEIFVTLKANPNGLNKEQLLELWRNDRSDNKEARLIEAISNLRGFFNSIKPGLGKLLLPDARKNSGLYLLVA